MKKFFEETDLKHLSLETKWIRNIDILTWTRNPLKHMYWRFCYTYILCSVLGAFETSYQAKTADEDNGKGDDKPLSMVLTGVQGTGKSVLGAFLALVFSKAGWLVTYRWGNTAHTFGDVKSLKKITVWDTSVIGPPISVGSGFFLVVSSCNEKRWHELAQQEVWSSAAGNYIFIDPVPKTEIADMASEKGREAAEANYRIVGGVARLCQRQRTEVLEKVDAGLSHFMSDLPGALTELNRLSDGVRMVEGRKIYPGLLAHFQPTDPYRNQATLEVSSEYVKAHIQAAVEKQSESEIQKLMQDLIPINKARGFAGLIWEPLFTRKSKKRTGRLVIVGSELPAKNKEGQKLLDVEVGKVSHFEFKNVEDFKTKCTTLFESKSPCDVAMWKAATDNYVAIDGVAIIAKHASKVCVVAGLQLTVAQEYHLLVENGVLDLVDMADHVATLLPGFTIETEIWFLQPEECLRGTFNFVNLQPLSFDELRDSTPPVQQPRTKSGRVTKQTTFYSSPIAGTPKKSSNDRTYWNSRVRKVTQRIAIARFEDSGQTSGTQQEGNIIEKELQDALRKACSTNNPFANSVMEPTRRTRESTNGGLEALREVLHATVLSIIESGLTSEWSVIDDHAPQDADHAPQDAQEETESMDVD